MVRTSLMAGKGILFSLRPTRWLNIQLSWLVNSCTLSPIHLRRMEGMFEQDVEQRLRIVYDEKNLAAEAATDAHRPGCVGMR